MTEKTQFQSANSSNHTEQAQFHPEAEEVPCVKFMLFSAEGEEYAIFADEILEIEGNAKIHSLPFVPDYIEGIVNVHGIAYTALNTVALLEGRAAEIKGAEFLVLKNDAHFCLKISNAETFFEIPETEFAADEIASGNFRRVTVPYKNREVKIVNPLVIKEKLEIDLNK